jgi:hypothetical protein
MAAIPPTAAWNHLLEQHVHVIDNGHASQVDYAGMQAEHAQLDQYTRSLSKVSQTQFDHWNKHAQMAFLINAYNAFTVQLILTSWPKLDSIKDLGGWFSSPWKKRFFTLLGKKRTLDEVEGMLRKPGRYDDPRIHFAINCASIGCPMLQPHAYTGKQLDQQLDQATADFLGDHKRNRYDAKEGVLNVSKIFDWYADDFRRGSAGPVRKFLAAHARQLSDDATARTRIANGNFEIGYLDYNWQLNATGKRHAR